MRPILAASLLLSPMLVTASAVASQPKVDAGVTASTPVVTTGVTAAEILDAASLHIQPNVFDKTAAPEEQVVLSLQVDGSGHAQNVHVVNSTNARFDARVIDAIQKSRFRPAKLDNQAVSMPLTLVVHVQNPVR